MESRPAPGRAEDLPSSVWAGLVRAQRQGLIGPGDLGSHVSHAASFVDGIERGLGRPCRPDDLVVDLGSGGGLPGLVVAARLPLLRIALVEGSTRRASFLRQVVTSAGWADRVEVLADRAETVGRLPGWRSAATAVTARGFGSPAETAECASPLLQVAGVLVVSEPPSSEGERWDEAALRMLGMQAATVVGFAGGRFALIHQGCRCPERYPRRVGLPRKRPLF